MVNAMSGNTSRSGCARKSRRRSRDLVPNQSVIRIIDNVDEFRRLCERRAPGADRFVDWVEDMEDLAGEEFTVEDIDEEDRAYKIDHQYRVPFDACILVRM